MSEDTQRSAMDGLASPVADSPLSEINMPSPLESPSPSPSPSPSIQSEHDSEDHSQNRMGQSASDSDEDAEGSIDEDFGAGTVERVRESTSPAERSSASSVSQSRKRKFGDDDLEAAIADNPELYGYRRSVRSRAIPRRVIDSSDDQNEDSASDAVARPSRRRKLGSTAKSSKAPTPNVPSDSESGSEAYVGRRRDVLSKKAKQRRRDILDGKEAPTTAEVRFSTRTRGPVTKYNDDEDMFEEEDDDAVAEWYIDTSPYVDRVLYHRLKEGSSFSQEEVTKNDFEFLIKWQGSSALHSTWHDYDYLKTVRGIKKVQNYIFAEVRQHIAYETDKSLPADDKEAYLIHYELTAEKIASENKPDRVINSQVVEGGTQYYVKWKGLEYEHCSWEFEDAFDDEPPETKEMFLKAIDDHIQRKQNVPKSVSLKTRPPFKRFTEQPEYIKFGKLRDFQMDGLNRLCLHWTGYHNIMLADEMGLGKTVQTVSFLNFLRHDRDQQGPFLVVVPLSTMSAWADTFDNWTPDINYIVYHGSKASLEIIQQHELLEDRNPKRPRFNVLLTTYEVVNRNINFLKAIKWQYLAVDEAHRLKNSESQLYETLQSIHFDSKLLITGTPMQNNLLELKSLMDFLMPGLIQVDPKLDLTNIEGASEQLAQLRSDINKYMIRRTKAQVMKELPPKTEKVLRVDLSDMQQDLCKNITLRNYEALNQGVQGQKFSLANVLMELKKASNHPLLFPATEERLYKEDQSREERLRNLVVTSGKMMLLDKLLERLKREGHRVLIFSQMVKVLHILAEYLRLRGHKFQQLDGTTSSTARRLAIDRFNAPGSEDFTFLLSTRAGGLGINLMTADTVILFDSDWNPHADLQAMGRAHRIGQTKPVTIYRLVSADSIEEKIIEAAKNKLVLEYVTIQRGGKESELQEQASKKGVIVGGERGPTRDDMARILKFGATKLFQPNDDNQKKLEALDIDQVLASAEEHNTELPEGPEPDMDDNDDFLKAFEVTDVKLDDLGWDEIVPEAEVKRIRDEEAERKTQEMLKQLQGVEGPRQRKRPGDMSVEERNQRAAKKRARDAQREAAGEVEESDDEQIDPKKPLNEAETRRLINAYTKWGAFEDMPQQIMESARLTKRDPELIKRTLQDIIDVAKNASSEEVRRLQALETDGNKAVTKKERKEVLVEYNKVKRLNATTLLERPDEMRLIREMVANAPDKQGFRIPEAMKPAQDFTCTWGGREDGMLMVGVAKHGWGAWPEIRDDPELDMKDKCFLEEQRAANKDARKDGAEAAEVKARKPTQVHLNRRANYLVSVLKAKASGDLDALENHHRNIKKTAIPDGVVVPGMPPRRPHGQEKHRHRAHSQSLHARDRTGTPDARHLNHKGHRPDTSHRIYDPSLKRRHDDGSSYDSHKRQRLSEHTNGSPAGRPQHKAPKVKGPRDENADKETQELMAPVMDLLSALNRASKDPNLDKKAKLALIKNNTCAIGDWIEHQDDEKTRHRFWDYVGHRGFNGSPMSAMLKIYKQLKGQPTPNGTSNGTSNGTRAAPAPPPAAAATAGAS